MMIRSSSVQHPEEKLKLQCHVEKEGKPGSLSRFRVDQHVQDVAALRETAGNGCSKQTRTIRKARKRTIISSRRAVPAPAYDFDI